MQTLVLKCHMFIPEKWMPTKLHTLGKVDHLKHVE